MRNITLNYMESSPAFDPGPVLTDEELVELEGLGTIIHRPRGTMLFGQGEETDFVLVIRKGTVRVTKIDPAGPRKIGKSRKSGPAGFMVLRRAGQVVGEQAAIRPAPRSASVYAEGAVEALYLSATVWRQFLWSHPRASLAQLAVSYDRQDESDWKLVESSSLAVEQKLAKALIGLEADGLGDQSPEGTVLLYSQAELAQLIKMSPEAVGPVIRALKARGIVNTGRNKTIICDIAALREIAQGEQTASG
jgi:CRP/FNR family cyclic AMP-dependent transcriptional regulator